MHADFNHPGLKKYREARAKDKAIAILRNEIRQNNANLSNSQVEKIAQAAYRAQNAQPRTIKVKGKGRKHHSRKSKNNKTLTVKVEVVNSLKK